MSDPERPAAPPEERAEAAGEPAATAPDAPGPAADAPPEAPPRPTFAELGFGGWARAHRAQLEILAIAVMAIGGIVCMFITTLALIFGLRR